MPAAATIADAPRLISGHADPVLYPASESGRHRVETAPFPSIRLLDDRQVLIQLQGLVRVTQLGTMA
jgi:hypothetical protein